MLFKETVAAYSENHTKPVTHSMDKNADLLDIKAGGKYSNHSALKG
jgi:hypothetical protein